MGRALYREYRPHSLKDVAGQPHITGALERALETGKISHAYLFTGPRGVGKTSVARILAHKINGLDYNGDENYLDIIEIDAASNRGIEDVRELRDKVAVAPTSSKYKVYIIDEVHMLTTPAFNALLKTLEEPPAHVVFILATTEAHKVPETIISRTQHFAFRPISIESIIEHLKSIAKSENISINDDALKIIATHGNGSFRDSIGLLDQVQQGKDTITSDDIRSLFGIAPESAIIELINNITMHEPAEVHNIYSSLLEQGITANGIASQLIRFLRTDLQSGKYKVPPKLSLELISKLIEVAPSVNPEISLEVILLGEAISDVESTRGQVKIPGGPEKVVEKPKTKEEPLEITINAPEEEVVISELINAPKLDLHKTSSRSELVSIELKPILSGGEVPVGTSTTEKLVLAGRNSSDEAGILRKSSKVEKDKPDMVPKNTENFWPEALLIVKASHYTLYGVLRLASFESSDKEVTLGFKFKLHKKKASDPKNIDIITDAIQQCTGKIYSITCVIDETTNETVPTAIAQKKPIKDIPETNKNEPLSTISNIFGGGELLES